MLWLLAQYDFYIKTFLGSQHFQNLLFSPQVFFLYPKKLAHLLQIHFSEGNIDTLDCNLTEAVF